MGISVVLVFSGLLLCAIIMYMYTCSGADGLESDVPSWLACIWLSLWRKRTWMQHQVIASDASVWSRMFSLHNQQGRRSYLRFGGRWQDVKSPDVLFLHVVYALLCIHLTLNGSIPQNILRIATLLVLRWLDHSKYLLGFGTLLAKFLLHFKSMHNITQQSVNSVSYSLLLFWQNFVQRWFENSSVTTQDWWCAYKSMLWCDECGLGPVWNRSGCFILR